jgi:hypothetical protein
MKSLTIGYAFARPELACRNVLNDWYELDANVGEMGFEIFGAVGICQRQERSLSIACQSRSMRIFYLVG